MGKFMAGYKETCAQCNGHNFYVTPATGMCYCFNCGYTTFQDNYRNYQQIRYNDIPAIRSLYTELTELYHSYADHVRPYLLQRGVTDAEIEKYKLGYCPPGFHTLYNDDHAIAAGVAKKDGTAFLAGRVVFPYIFNNSVTDLRGRSLDKSIEPRYLSPYGGAFYRGADYPFLWKETNIVITEGELKALAIQRAGFDAIGVPGILSVRPKSRFYVVCFDSDRNPKSMADVQRAVIRIARVYPHIKIATLPLDASDDKMGADDFIDKHGVDAFQRVINAALPFDKWKRLML
jgi:DNA primase